jgi:hypothetical protein
VDAPQRVLIDWDFAAHGIWSIRSAEELSAPAPPGRWMPWTDTVIERPRPWSHLLSSALLDALQEWNDTGEALFGPGGKPADAGHEIEGFWELAAELAERTQQELGPHYEVLYQTPQDAWRWVRPPSGFVR